MLKTGWDHIKMEIKKEKHKVRHRIFIAVQFSLLFLFLGAVFLFYPRANLEINGNAVRFDSNNAEIIVISENPDFSNPRYFDIDGNISFYLKPGIYYWKADNGIIESLGREFTVNSEVGLKIIDKDSGQSLQNVGNVKVNVSKTSDGGFVGHIILEPDESSDIEEGEYIGRDAR